VDDDVFLNYIGNTVSKGSVKNPKLYCISKTDEQIDHSVSEYSSRVANRE
ncbi:MAG: hypothetical protein ACI8RD_004942, partial [Bacillariaceae sp.]|jgi:hypothetical protein